MPSRTDITPAKRAALIGMLGALAIALSIAENLFMGMFNLAVPGLKPGLANIAVVLALVYLGGGWALAIASLKAAAVFLATGVLSTFLFSLAGSLLSAAGMWLLWRTGKGFFSLAGVSALGGALNNLAQVGVMMALSGTAEFIYYLPLLSLFGVGFGFLIGLLANLVVRRLPPVAAIPR